MTKTQAVKFIGLVDRMRDAQKRYFANRDRAALIESKSLETQVDRQLFAFKRDAKEESNSLFAQQPWD
ncbi:MAG: hypothetical protein LIP09_00730 [Bacteroidales bacterium]|nr:hypothetical protein [Bacteroidales bacterium]